MRGLTIALAMSCLTVACSLTPLNEIRPLALSLPLLLDFENGTLDGFHPELPTPANGQITTSPVFGGTRAVVLTVGPGQVVNHGNRAELGVYRVGQWGERLYFGWRFMIPASDPDGFGWQILAQWYQLPDFWHGETFDFFYAHPPVVLTYTPGFVEVQTSVGGEKTVGKTALTKGVWHSAVVEINFRDDATGSVQAWLDGTPFTPFNGTDARVYGPTLHNKAGAYFKVGLYRGAPDQTQAPTTNSVVVDNVAVGRSYAEALP